LDRRLWAPELIWAWELNLGYPACSLITIPTEISQLPQKCGRIQYLYMTVKSIGTFKVELSLYLTKYHAMKMYLLLN